MTGENAFFQDDFRQISNRIKSATRADICHLAGIRSQSLEPLSLAGAREQDFYDASVPQFMLHYLSLPTNQPALRSVFDLPNAAKLIESAKLGNITQYLPIPLVFDESTHCLVSLFFDDNRPLPTEELKRIVRSVPDFKADYESACKKLNIWQACQPPSTEKIVCRCPAQNDIINKIAQIARANSNVLIYGESGTGKELVARCIHACSLRQGAEFVPLDCVAIPPNLLESEMFGYEKGAFTGAARTKHGLMELAHHGTLFLDEISELEAALQAKLLRVLQERQFRRIGGNSLIDVDIRVLSAMNVKPAKAVATGRLRKDLFYRLNVIPFYLPPLRQRKGDIPLLVDHFLKLTVQKNQLEPKAISREAMRLLQQYRWPGNIRQLQNIVERLALLSEGPIITENDLPEKIRHHSEQRSHTLFDLPFKQAKNQEIEKFEKRYFSNLLKDTDHNIAEAARIAGISERTIYRMIRQYGAL